MRRKIRKEGLLFLEQILLIEQMFHDGIISRRDVNISTLIIILH
jgi:hypothetical protein